MCDGLWQRLSISQLGAYQLAQNPFSADLKGDQPDAPITKVYISIRIAVIVMADWMQKSMMTLLPPPKN